MMRQYIKQAWQGFSENKLQSRLTLFGTALSVCMIMVLVLVDQVKYGPFPPETHREKMLFVSQLEEARTEGENYNMATAGVGMKAINELFTDLETTNLVAFVNSFYDTSVGTNVGTAKSGYRLNAVSEKYWDMYDFTFVEGSIFTDEEVRAGLNKAVISDELAEELFGGDSAVGKTITINSKSKYQVTGVIRKPAKIVFYSNGDLWVPYTSEVATTASTSEAYTGSFEVMMRPDGNGSKKEIRKEIDQRVAQVNQSTPGLEIKLYGAPDSYRASRFRQAAAPIDLKSYYTQQAVLFSLFFLVPAVNIATLTHSRIKKRTKEIGLRRAYGANRGNILNQVLWESLLYTAIGAVIGFILSIITIYLFQEIFFGQTHAGIALWTLIRPRIIGIVIVATLLLNICSAIIPAFWASRKTIIDALDRR